MFRTVLLFTGPREILVRRSRERFSPESNARNIRYEVRKSDLIDALGDLEDSSSLILMDQYLRSLEDDEDEEEIE
jgi:hypothetical protein